MHSNNPIRHPFPRVPRLGNGTKGVSEAKIAEKHAAGAITDIKITPEETRLTVAVTMDRLLAPTEFLLENPPRLVLDFPNTENKVVFTQVPVHDASVIRVRVQQFQRVPIPIARVVIDLQEGFGTHQIDTSNHAVRLVFNKSKTKFAAGNSVPAAAPRPAENSSKLNNGSAASIVKPSLRGAAGSSMLPPTRLLCIPRFQDLPCPTVMPDCIPPKP